MLLRKHRADPQGHSASPSRCPTAATTVVEAILEGLLLRGSDRAEQLALDGIGLEARAGPGQRVGQRRRAGEAVPHPVRPAGIQPARVAREVAEMRARSARAGEVATFAADSAARLRRRRHHRTDRRLHRDHRRSARRPARTRSVTGHAEPLPFHRDLPVRPREAVLTRTDPVVGAIAATSWTTALDPDVPAMAAAPPGAAA